MPPDWVAFSLFILISQSCWRGLTTATLCFASWRYGNKTNNENTSQIALFVIRGNAPMCKPTPLPLITNATQSGGILVIYFDFSELLTRLELVTSSLPRKCSTTELQQHFCAKSRAKVVIFFDSANFFATNSPKHFVLDSIINLKASPQHTRRM